jgi:hypothetical protein
VEYHIVMITDRELAMVAERLLSDHLDYTEEEGEKEYDPEDESIHCGHCATFIGLDYVGVRVSAEGWGLCVACHERDQANEG